MTHVQFAVDDTRASLRAGGDIRPRRHRRPGSLLPRRRPIHAELSQTLPLACLSHVCCLLFGGVGHLCPLLTTMGNHSIEADR